MLYHMNIYIFAQAYMTYYFTDTVCFTCMYFARNGKIKLWTELYITKRFEVSIFIDTPRWLDSENYSAVSRTKLNEIYFDTQ